MSELRDKIMMIYENALNNVYSISEEEIINFTLGKIIIDEPDIILIKDFIKQFHHYYALYNINKEVCNPDNYNELIKLGCDIIDTYHPYENFSAYDYFTGKIFIL
jgi:hypothetical protein